MKKVSLTLRILAIRHRSAKRAFVSGYPVDNGILDGTRPVVVLLNAALVQPDSIYVGDLWSVRGPAHKTKLEVNGVQIPEWQITAQAAELVCPCGSQIINWLADNVDGIGPVKANKLWDQFGEELYSLLDAGNRAAFAALQTIIPKAVIVETLLAVWAENGDAASLKFVQERRIPLDIARKAIKFYQRETPVKLSEDPYRLLAFCGNFKQVDGLARKQFGITKNDIRRRAAAVEQALYSAFDHGHTCLPAMEVMANAKTLMGNALSDAETDELLTHGHQLGVFVCNDLTGETLLHPTGAWLMEKQVTTFLKTLLQPQTQANLFTSTINVDRAMTEFEQQERICLGISDFALNAAQRQAVKTSFTHRFSVITGGAGTGKTTVLKALYHVLNATGRPRWQMALSGRATARMIEATHEPARTIEGFLRNVKREELGPTPIIVIDEASMLDLLTFFRLTRRLPEGAHVILVGDVYQLPPVGAGLVFHCLCGLPQLPKTELTVVKRQAGDSGIPVVAELVRNGVWPALPTDTSQDVSFIRCADTEILPTVMRLYGQNRSKTQILGATKANPHAGIERINDVAHDTYVSHNKMLTMKNEFSGELEDTGLREGDLILYTANDWGRDLQNGSLGVLTTVFDNRPTVNIGTEEYPMLVKAFGIMQFEGRNVYLLKKDIDVLELAYAITVHKAQGSQFDTVIIPVVPSRILDRTLVYTAITRAQTKVILVGNEAVARKAVLAPPKAFGRRVGVGTMLNNAINSD